MKKIIWRDFLGITIGAVITAISLNMFLIPNKVAAGGVSGLATVLHYLLNWPVGIIMLAFNIPGHIWYVVLTAGPPAISHLL
jgi:uncharacterized membrane-anchored protein YitT (DUF2179 family)